jgi:hypothetical protein
MAYCGRIRSEIAEVGPLEPGAFEVMIERGCRRNVEGAHDGKAHAIGEAQARVIEAFIHIQCRVFQRLVRAYEVNGAARQETPAKQRRVRRMQARSEEGDRLVHHVMRGEQQGTGAQRRHQARMAWASS